MSGPDRRRSEEEEALACGVGPLARYRYVARVALRWLRRLLRRR